MNKNTPVDYVKIIISLILIIVSVFIFFTALQQKRTRGETACDVGSFYKDEISPYEYSGNTIVSQVGVKAGTDCTFFKINGSDNCFRVTGLGTINVKVEIIGPGPTCKGISHVSFYSSQVETPTLTPPEQPTPTPTIPGVPSDTPIPTSTKTPTPTRTPTPLTTFTPTKTPSPSLTLTLTPSESPIPTETPSPSDKPLPSGVPSNTPTDTLTPNPSVTLTSPPGITNTPTEIILVKTTEGATIQPTTSGLPSVGTVTGWLIVIIPLALVILAFVF